MKLKKISEELEKIRVYQIDQLIKRIDAEYGLNDEWEELAKIKDRLALLVISMRELEAKKKVEDSD